MERRADEKDSRLFVFNIERFSSKMVLWGRQKGCRVGEWNRNSYVFETKAETERTCETSMTSRDYNPVVFMYLTV